MLWSISIGRLDFAFILFVSLVLSAGVNYVSQRVFGKTGEYFDVLFALLLVFNNLFGLTFDFYHTVPGWDIATHYTTSLFLAVAALLLLQKAYPQLLMQATPILIVMAILLFSVGLGGIWEIGEYAADVLKQSTFQGGLDNTMQDLIVDAIAGLVVGIAWVKRGK